MKGKEWWKTKEKMESGTMTYEQAREQERSSKTYQIEKPGPNRSRKYEAK
ncbi:MAG: GH-E family nuclease [Myxococcota bacterium]